MWLIKFFAVLIVSSLLAETSNGQLTLTKEILYEDFGVSPDDMFAYVSMADIVDIDPDTFTEMDQLLILSLYSNLLTTINPDIFVPLEQLLYLDLSSNRITELDPLVFAGLENLIYIYLSMNQIEQLDPLIFQGAMYVIGLIDLSQNRIYKLESAIFHNLEELFSLNLNRNQIEVIDAELFRDLVSLEDLSLAYNRLTEIDPLAFQVIS